MTLLTREERCVGPREGVGKKGNVTIQPIFSSTHRQNPGLGSQLHLLLSVAKEERMRFQELSWLEGAPGGHPIKTPLCCSRAMPEFWLFPCMAIQQHQGLCHSVWPPSQQEKLLIIYSEFPALLFAISLHFSEKNMALAPLHSPIRKMQAVIISPFTLLFWRLWSLSSFII